MLKNYPNPKNKCQIEEYLSKWRESPFKEMEEILNSLFKDNYPTEDNLQLVVCQVSVLNHFYNARVRNDDILNLAIHISKIKDFEARVKSGDLELAKEISKCKKSGTHQNYYSFASKYCSFFNPEKYPIYDSQINDILWHYWKDNPNAFKEIKVLKDESHNYEKFVKEVDYYIDSFDLGEEYKYKKIDQYLWMFYDIVKKKAED